MLLTFEFIWHHTWTHSLELSGLQKK